ncbi:hypothetical protein ABNQ38_14865 [Azospirillum sp. A29]|jgi:hypothetical protein|uniref:hypothetical protein n=1 Tax=Azospirillum sp. A29 TaxID=3160606 RepID=UPI00366AEC32
MNVISMVGSFVPSSFAAALPAQNATTEPTAHEAAAILPFGAIRMLQDLFSHQACIAGYAIILFATFHDAFYTLRDSNSFGVQVSEIAVRWQNCHFDGATRE